jgi:iron complex transport system ATP-binding protein
VEEIMPVFSHVLLLKAGRVLAAGGKKAALNSRNLSQLFNAKMRLAVSSHRYGLKIS